MIDCSECLLLKDFCLLKYIIAQVHTIRKQKRVPIFI